MRRKGNSFFMMLFTIAIILLLGYVWVEIFFGELPEHENPAIGAKQEAVYLTYSKRFAISSYAEQAISHAAEKAIAQAVEDKQGTLAERLARHTETHFSSYMQQYPEDLPLSYDQELSGTQLTLSSEILLPIDYGERVGSSSVAASAGVLRVWPTTGEKVITSLFGKRNAGVRRSSKNHPGIDIRGNFGDPVLAMGSGVATPIRSSNGNWFIELVMDSGWTCHYLHVAPRGLVGSSQVNPGDVIAEIVDEGYSPHVDIRCFNHVEPLTVEQAIARFGPQHVGGSAEHPSGMTLGAVSSGRVFIDAYCLFSQDFRSGPGSISLSHERITGLAFREGVSVREKLESTCQAYLQTGILQPEKELTTSSGVTPNAYFQQMLDTLQKTPYVGSEIPTGSTLYDLLVHVAEQEEIPLHLLVAFAVQGFSGSLEARTLDLQAPLQVFQEYGEDGDQGDVYWHVVAVSRHVSLLLEQYASYTQQVRFLALEYSAGDVVFSAVSEAGADPSYEELFSFLTADFLAEHPTYSSASEGVLEQRISELQDYGDLIALYAGMAGGALPPNFASRTNFGFYKYVFSQSVELPIEKLHTYDTLASQLERCRFGDQACVSLASRVAQSVGEVSRCTPYHEQLEKAVAVCAQAMRQTPCGCRLPVPSRYAVADASPVASSVEFFSDEITVQYVDGTESTVGLNWLLQEENDWDPVSFSFGSGSGSTLSWDLPSHTLQLWSAPSEQSTPLLVGEMIVGDDLWVFLQDPETSSVGSSNLLVGFSNAQPISTSCNVEWEEQYCLEDIGFWVSQGLPVS